jgi:glycosyltransferase involved in cell wall biosynthesis
LFRRYIELQQPDLIHFHCVQRLTASTLEVAQQYKIPYFVTLHDSWWLCDRQFMLNNHGLDCEQVCVDPLVCSGCVEDIDGSIARRSCLTKQLKNASLLLAVSRYQQQLYKHNGFDNVVLNCNGIFKRDGVQRKAHNGKLQMGYVGGVCVHKGYYFLEEVVKNIDLKQSEIIVVDFGLQSGKVRRKTWGSTSVRFIPKLPFADMPAFYSKLDVVIVPSLWRESFGLVIREAIVNSVWVVAPEAGGLAEDIRQGIDGHIFSKGSKEELAAVLKEIDSNPSFYQGRRSIDTSHIRSVEDQVEELVSFYNTVLNTADVSISRFTQNIFQPNVMGKS